MSLTKNTDYHDNHSNGNGWSKYQIMVLQQLEDHNRVLQNLNKELSDVKQQMAVFQAETTLWRSSTMSALESLEKKMSPVLYDEEGLNRKVTDIERHFEVEEKSSQKLKALWAFYGAVVVFVTNILVKVAEFVLKN